MASAAMTPQQQLANSPGFQQYLKSQRLTNPFDINSGNAYERQLAQDWVNRRTRDFVNNGGLPVRPEFKSMIDPNTGLLKANLNLAPTQMAGVGSVVDPMKANLDKVQLNKQGLEALRGEALRTGPSAWNNLMKQNLSARELAELDKVGAQAIGANAAAQNSLAMRGGLSSGSRVSLAKDMQKNINQGAQNTRRGIGSDALNVDIQDELKRMDTLKSLPGMELASLQPEMDKANSLNNAMLVEQGRNLDVQKYNADTANAADKFNIQAALNEKLQERGYDVNAYNEAMRAFAAQKQGEAMSGGGKK